MMIRLLRPQLYTRRGGDSAFRISQPVRTLSSDKRSPAFVLDIDGVLIRGNRAIPEAPKALELLNQRAIPWVLVTNGGGRTETARVADLSQKLGGKIQISPRQILQSHTPFQELTKKYNRVLVVGGDGDNCRHVAQSYGFEEVVLTVDIIAKLGKQAWPFHRFQADEIAKWARTDVNVEDKFDAVLVFADPRDMGTDLQIVLDLLLSQDGRLSTRRSGGHDLPGTPIHFSNNDLLWANSYHLPRFGQGAFRIMVEALYKELNEGIELQSQIIGKPSNYTYQFAERLLAEWQHPSKPLSQDTEVYMVGDNPASDIKGANDYGWKSILVRTGVYKDSDLEQGLVATPDHIFDNILEAVETITRQ